VLSGLVERLLDVSRMASGPLRLEPEEFELGSLIREIVDRMAVDGGRETYIHQPAELSVTWDRQRIDRLISNLLGNAYTYAAGQPVSVRLQAVDGGAVRIEVRDRGPGIPAEDQARIFGLFEQSQPRGALSGFGFGLWVSRQIVEAHGGRIWVESTLGNGACFVAEMPSRLTLSHGS
jgi:signal transduction histidine kinase